MVLATSFIFWKFGVWKFDSEQDGGGEERKNEPKDDSSREFRRFFFFFSCLEMLQELTRRCYRELHQVSLEIHVKSLLWSNETNKQPSGLKRDSYR